MRQIRLLGVAFITVFALGVTMAIVAYSEPAIKILPEGERTWKGKNDESSPKLVALFGSLQCENATATGTEEKTKPLGLFHVEFTGCKDAATKITCTGLGDKEGVILVLGTWHLVYDEIKPELLTATLVLPEVVHLSCSALVLIEVKGEVLCLDLEPLVKLLSHLFHCHQKEALSLEKTYWPDNGEEKEITGIELLCSKNHGTFEHCAALGLGSIEHTEPLFADD